MVHTTRGADRIQLSKSKKATCPYLSGGGPRPWADRSSSHQVTKLHTFSFFAIPAILHIVAQTGHKQKKAGSLPPYVTFPRFLVLSYSVPYGTVYTRRSRPLKCSHRLE